MNEEKTLTPADLDTLRHMLGINDRSRRNPEPYRDYYAAESDCPEMVRLQALGAVRCYGPWAAGELTVWRTTDFGRTAAMKSAMARRLPKKARVYRKFLDVSECCPDLTFREFLTAPEWSEQRRTA